MHKNKERFLFMHAREFTHTRSSRLRGFWIQKQTRTDTVDGTFGPQKETHKEFLHTANSGIHWYQLWYVHYLYIHASTCRSTLTVHTVRLFLKYTLAWSHIHIQYISNTAKTITKNKEQNSPFLWREARA